MDMNIRQVIIERNKTYIKARTDKNVTFDEIYATSNPAIYFKVIKIETIDQYIVEVTLEQIGSYYKRIKTSEDATLIMYDELSHVTDKEIISRVNRESCYC